MREEIANLVQPILSHGLALRDRLEAQGTLNLEVEQAALKAMLLTEPEAQRWLDYGGETVREKPHAPGTEPAIEDGHFLGIRYALTCWLDELFILYSPWERAWTERKLEAALYGTNDRAWRFWEQARKAESRSGTDALEAFYLCVMLGFRGELGQSPDALEKWISATQARLSHQRTSAWQPPPELDPPTFVPPLRARESFQRMVMTCGMGLLVAIPIVVFLVVRRLGQ